MKSCARSEAVAPRPWGSPLPYGWRTVRIGTLFRVVGGSTPPSSVEDYWDGDVVWVTPEDISRAEDGSLRNSRRHLTHAGVDKSGTRLVPPGSIILATRAPIGPVALAQVELCTNQGCRALVPRYRVDTRYFYYQLRVLESILQAHGQGSTFKELSTPSLSAIRLVLPPETEQTRIADELQGSDDAMRNTENLKHNQLTLLAERRVASITEAVFGAGNVATTTVRFARLISSIEQGWSPVCENRPAGDGEWGVLKLGCVNGGRFRADNKALPSSLTPRADLEVQAGDFLISRANTSELVGSAAVVERTPPRLILSDLLYRIRLRADVNPYWLAYALASAPMRAQIEGAATGASASMQKVSQATLRQLEIPLPGPDGQAKIVEDLDRELAADAEMGSLISRELGLIRERQASRTMRTSLGSEAVI